jgi:hypothetical protein
MASACPLCRICTARLHPQTLAATLQVAVPTSLPLYRAAALGISPESAASTKNQRGRRGGRREELESLGECHSWRRLKPLVLVVVRPCVAAAKPEQPEPGMPTPKPEPSVVKSPPRNRSRTCWRRHRAALLPLQQAEPPVFFLCSTAPSSPLCPGAQGEPQPLDLVVDPAFEPWLDRAL